MQQLELNLAPMQKTVLNRATRMILASGVDAFALKIGDEIITHGDIKIVAKDLPKPAVPKASKKAKKRTHTHPYGYVSKVLADQGVNAMQVGDVKRIDARAAHCHVDGLQGSLIYLATKLWGRGSVTTQRGHGYIDVMRIA